MKPCNTAGGPAYNLTTGPTCNTAKLAGASTFATFTRVATITGTRIRSILGVMTITFPFTNPEEGSWVGVRVENVVSQTNTFQVYVARVKSVDHEGYAVSFLNEKSKGFFISPNNEDIYPVHRYELVILQSPS
ncbi:hypothetical protein Pcinc_036955 [Petrolisthes cinctipes]|uniref:Uncharacterized protein n=1 Tax=Petrolisthes cinctipes TaxID=88211 RepID=A0AAE1BTP2_PETCI|nr:hypothetical protein Pcinc_036955 [Petrolisthes cinctipes]